MYTLLPLADDAFSGDPLVALGRLQQNWLDNGLGVFGYWQAWLQDTQTLQGALWREYLDWCEQVSAVAFPAATLFSVPPPGRALAGQSAVSPVQAVDDLSRIQGISRQGNGNSYHREHPGEYRGNQERTSQ